MGCAKTWINTCLFGTTMVTFVISSYVVFKLHKAIHPAAVVAFGTILGMNSLLVRNCFHNCYYLQQLSSDIIAEHQARTLNKITARVLKSLKPIEVQVGIYFTIKRSTTFIFISLAIHNTITWLVAF